MPIQYNTIDGLPAEPLLTSLIDLLGNLFNRTQTYNQWRELLILTLRFGFDIIGTVQGKHGLLYDASLFSHTVL